MFQSHLWQPSYSISEIVTPAKVDTTLLVYFFGRRGNDQLRFEDFQPFVENLQTEVLQMEYHEFSKGADTITELDFARILLRCMSFLGNADFFYLR